jgi:hypothetical protein
MPEWIERVPSWVAVTSAASFVAAVTFECSYFFVVGARFQSFMGVQDYLQNALLWLPIAGVFVLALSVVQWPLMDRFLARSKGVASMLEAPTTQAKSPIHQGRFSWLLIILTVLYVGFALWNWWVADCRPLAWAVSAMACLQVVGTTILLREVLRGGGRGVGYPLAAAFAFALISLHGVSVGCHDAGLSKRTYDSGLKLITETGETFWFLRTVGSGALVRDLEAPTVHFFKLDSLRSVSKDQQRSTGSKA